MPHDPAKPQTPPDSLGRDQAVLCPALGSIIAEGGVALDAQGNFKLSAIHDYLVKYMNVSEGFAGLCIGLGPFSNTLHDVLGNILAAHVNALDLRVGMAQHPGDSGVLRGGQFDEARFDALVSHSKTAVRDASGKIVDGTMTLREVAEAVLANVQRDGSPRAYTKGLPTALFEFGSLINILGQRDPITGERTVSIAMMRNLYEHKKLPPQAQLQARPPTTIADLTDTMAQMAASMPADAKAPGLGQGLARHALTQAFHEVSGAIHTTLGLLGAGRAPYTPPPAPAGQPAAPVPPFTAPKSIEEVLAGLDSIMEASLRSPNRIGYFAGLYQSVTATIRRSVVAGVFEDNARMARLDVIFANRFLEAWHTYRAGGAPTASYKLAFDALPDPRLLVVQHQLLALNAHIFLDLGIACATVAPGAALQSLHSDFLKINAILERFVGIIELKIGSLSPVIAGGEAVARRFETKVINFSLLQARDAAWRFAERLAGAPPDAWPALIEAQDQATVRLGEAIRSPGITAQPAIDVIRALESSNIQTNIIIVSE